ncbi:MAG: D-glycerate dehydrogenase, partial [Bacteriovoracaceae bacterium]|nr:D-glycerate dehydrogenase [Bacteriovoracaceae bacterium]
VEVVIWDKETTISKKELINLCQGANGLISMLADPIDSDFIDQCPDLKVISNYAVGYNNIDVTHASKRGIFVGNTPEVLTDATSDIAFALLISVARRIKESSTELKSWKTWEPMGYLGPRLKGKTLGIVGMGRIGQAMAQKCHFGWDMKIIYTANTRKINAENKMAAQKVDFEVLLRESDFISVHCPLTPDTKHLFDIKAFAAMKNSAIFINTARGEVVVQDELIHAIEKGEIWGAGLDVTTPEPLPMDNRLHKLKNVVITPHIGSADFESRTAMSELCANNIIAGLKGEKLPAGVN